MRQRPSARRIGRACGHALAAVAVWGVTGCCALERAEVSVVRRGAVQGAAFALDSSDAASRSDLGLLRAALALTSALGEPRPAMEGDAHFAGPSDAYLAIGLRGGGTVETWRLDGGWATRQLPGGAMLVWEGDLAPVVDAVLLAAPGRAASASLGEPVPRGRHTSLEK